ncbi:hypothetical protein [Aliikangiella coralliicola]|uniref:Uncharacterized protein n=1 Tax=Aliikangiella coralliicola TaxID=2592383 RepID=A0A545U0D0_9GAMM|nr:hypothetical protein [Aliikangiella coralliicola]TQV82920.1 hypothetical protein FLL46_24425 [Aliikangiella coralliicola]
MNSSISNSNSNPDSGSDSNSGSEQDGSVALNPRKAYLKIWLVALLGMAAAMLLVRLFTFAMGVKGENFLSRVFEAVHALPVMTEEKVDHVMVFGSSMVHAGFSPRQFDREMKEKGIDIKSYNFGFGGLNPYFQDYLSRRIKENYQKNNKRVKLAILEFNPFQTTKNRFNGAKAIMDAYVGMLASEEELKEVALSDPTRGALIYNIHYIRDNISAEMITFYFGRGLFSQERPKPEAEKDSQEIIDRRRELGDELSTRFKQDYPDYKDEDWSLSWQGGGTIPEERSAETIAVFKEYYETLRTPYRMESDKLWRERSADITHLHFEEELVKAFIRIVKNFQQFSDQVEVILLPKNSKWIVNTPEALERQNRVLRRIEMETGIKIKDFQNIPSITPEMFSDTTHLARYSGDIAFTHALVENYANDLKE